MIACVDMTRYVETLASEAKERYQTKIKLIGNIDPFTLGGKCSFPGVKQLLFPLLKQVIYFPTWSCKQVSLLLNCSRHTSLWKPITRLAVVGLKMLDLGRCQEIPLLHER